MYIFCSYLTRKTIHLRSTARNSDRYTTEAVNIVEHKHQKSWENFLKDAYGLEIKFDEQTCILIIGTD
jgi:hypothetical protein